MQNLHRRIRYSVFLGVFLSLMFYFGTKLLNATLAGEVVSYSPLDIAFPLIFSVILSLVFGLVLDFKFKIKSDKNFKLARWQIFLPLLISSIVILLAFFPGHLPVDANDMQVAFKTNTISTHYSPLITFLFGGAMSLGRALGSEEIGHLFFIIPQILFANFALTETIFFCSKKLKRKSFAIISTLFFVFHPLVQVLLIRSGQDTIFASIFVLLGLEFLKISENENYFSKNKSKKFIYLFIFTFFLCATRNNGFYALVPAILIGFFALKNNKTLRKNFLLALTIPLIVYFGINNLIIKKLVINESFFRETMNVPIMQIARAMYQNPDENFKEELKKYFKEDCDTWIHEKWNWEKYNKSAGISDPYKNCLILSEVEKDPLKFVDLWRRIGEKNPASFLEAPLVFTSGLYNPYVPRKGGLSEFEWHTYVDCFYTNCTYIKSSYYLPNFRNFIYNLVNDQTWSKVPVLHLLWSAPFSTFLILFGIFFAIYHKKREYLLPLGLTFGLLLTVALSPIMLFRYLLPVVFSTPILIYILRKILAK